eukprot:TRINITY_DN17011_c0_g1_i10.p1 TRINITY_DN17011_c0_g1~~TRINITY_DN17011_c0_g1_i10.p1  ORF type:complete len:267 (+),score=-21.51 TRINITY_DN17011_c0_g1_i10:1624-2424(+)
MHALYIFQLCGIIWFWYSPVLITVQFSLSCSSWLVVFVMRLTWFCKNFQFASLYIKIFWWFCKCCVQQLPTIQALFCNTYETLFNFIYFKQQRVNYLFTEHKFKNVYYPNIIIIILYQKIFWIYHKKVDFRHRCFVSLKIQNFDANFVLVKNYRKKMQVFIYQSQMHCPRIRSDFDRLHEIIVCQNCIFLFWCQLLKIMLDFYLFNPENQFTEILLTLLGCKLEIFNRTFLFLNYSFQTKQNMKLMTVQVKQVRFVLLIKNSTVFF